MQPPSRSARAAEQFEALEPRTLMSISMSSDGFIDVSPSKDSRVIYVSSSTGSDRNNGLSAKSPVRTIKHAKSMMRDGKPDEMLLKRGDHFDESFGHWTMSGRSSDEPMLLGSYGKGDRPLLNTGAIEGFATYDGHPIDNIVIDGIHFEANKYDGTNGSNLTTGIHLLRQGTGYIFQDLDIDGYKDNIVLQGDGTGVSSVILRRSVIENAFNVGKVGNGHAQGLYASGTTSHLMIEQNTFDHNGWKEGVAAANQFNHNIYINTGATNVTVRDNIIARASFNGVLLRSGGTIVDNLFFRNPVAAAVQNTSSTISGNVVLEGTDLPTQTFGVGFNIGNVPSATVSDNLIAHDKGTGPYGLAGISINNGAKDTAVSNNTIYDWRNNIVNGGTSGISVVNNVLNTSGTDKPVVDQVATFSKHLFYYGGNQYSSKKDFPFKMYGFGKTFKQWEKSIRETDGSWSAIKYVDPNRTLATYNQSLGGHEAVSAFLKAARDQSRHNWLGEYTAAAAMAYIRAGFNIETPITTDTLKLSPSRSYVTTTSADTAAESVTTLIPRQPLTVAKKPKKPAKKTAAQPEAETITASSESKSTKPKKQSAALAQMALIARIAGLIWPM